LEKLVIQHQQIFLDKVWPELGKIDESEEFHESAEFMFFEYCINFPRDNVITAYKWHCIVNQFGPLSFMKKNFHKFAVNGGFVGVVNSIQAAEILQLETVGTTLVRFSRLQPELATFSIKLNDVDTEAASFRFSHISRVTKEQLGVPYWKFIDKTLNLRALHHTTNSTDYYQRKKPYYRNATFKKEDL